MAAQTRRTTGLLDEIRGEITPPGTRCAVARIADRLTPAEAADLEAAIADAETYTAAAIARALTARGHRVSQGVIAHHRKGGCSCGR